MQISRKKIITVVLAFLILFALINWQTLRILIFWKPNEKMSIWDFLTARPVPSSFNQYPTPGAPGPILSNLPPIITPDYSGLLPWGVILTSKEMPHVEGVVWKTYTNKEYGFEMQYPEGWKIDSNVDNSVSNIMLEKMAVDQSIDFSFFPNGEELDRVSLRLLHHRNKDVADRNKDVIEYLKRYNKEFYGDNYIGPIMKNIVINNVNWLIDDSDVYDMQLSLYAEKNDYIYEFGNNLSPTRSNRNIIEYIIKSFHFVQ